MPALPSTVPAAPLMQAEPWKLLLAAFGTGVAFACVSLAGIAWTVLQLLHRA